MDATNLSATMATPVAERTIWAIDPAHSLVGFAVKHMMVATVKGRFSGISGRLAIDEADLSQSQVEVTIDVATIDTGDQKRDDHLRSADFFDVTNYPIITFRSTRIEPAGQDRWQVFGDLTIRGVTRSVVLDARFHGRGKTPWGSEVVAFTAATKINRKDFGLTWNVALEAGGVLVGDEVKIEIEVEATKQA